LTGAQFPEEGLTNWQTIVATESQGDFYLASDGDSFMQRLRDTTRPTALHTNQRSVAHLLDDLPGLPIPLVGLGQYRLAVACPHILWPLHKTQTQTLPLALATGEDNAGYSLFQQAAVLYLT
jgi:hypothetical protein